MLEGEAPANNLKLRLVKNPETGFQYSGGGYLLAQKIVVDLCKGVFCNLMREWVRWG